MDLHYGNINRENLKYLEIENIFTKNFNKFTSNPYPKFLESGEEINEIKRIQQNAEAKDNYQSILSFCEQWDSDLVGATKYWLKKLEIPNNKEYIDFLAMYQRNLVL